MKLRRPHFPRFDDMSLRSMIELMFAIIFMIGAGLGTFALISLSDSVSTATAAQKAATAGQQSDHRTIQVLRGQVEGLSTQASKLVAQAAGLGSALQDAETLLERRSPSLQFYVCAFAREADFIGAISHLDGAASPAQLKAFGVIADGPRKALTPTTDGGCLDPTIPVTVPPPVTIPLK